MKLSKSAWVSLMLVALFLPILIGLSLPVRSPGYAAGSHVKDIPSEPDIAIVETATYVRNLLLIEFFAGF